MAGQFGRGDLGGHARPLQVSGAHTWELDRDLHQARVRGNQKEAIRIMAAIQDYRADCSHVSNPEKRAQCYKCGRAMPVKERGPGVKRASPLSLDKRRIG